MTDLDDATLPRGSLRPGMVINMLTLVEERSGTMRGPAHRWLCVCKCGKETEAGDYDLRTGKRVSCGCSRGRSNRSHGKSRTRLYKTWGNMIKRCSNSARGRERTNYFERGVRVCDEWCASFEAFATYVGEHPGGEYSLDRIDSSKGYEPGNVRWATKIQQARNTRVVKLSESAADEIRRRIADGEAPKSVAKRFAVTRTTVHSVVAGRLWRAS